MSQTLLQNNTEPQGKQPPKFVTLSSLRPGTEGYNLIVKVTEVIPVVDKVRRDGTRMRVALIVIADQEASVVFVARGDQIEAMPLNATVQILNARVEMFNLYDQTKSRNGFMRLEVDKWGRILPSATPLSGQVSTKSMSTVEYELVERTSPDNEQ